MGIIWPTLIKWAEVKLNSAQCLAPSNIPVALTSFITSLQIVMTIHHHTDKNNNCYYD